MGVFFFLSNELFKGVCVLFVFLFNTTENTKTVF